MHKHLQHLYAKLDVTDRLSAVLTAQRLEFIGGLLATPLMALPADRIALQLTESFGGGRLL